MVWYIGTLLFLYNSIHIIELPGKNVKVKENSRCLSRRESSMGRKKRDIGVKGMRASPTSFLTISYKRLLNIP